MKTVLLILTTLVATNLLPAQSYERLKGRRLAQFTKTAGKTEVGRLVSLQFPASALAKASLEKAAQRGRTTFDWKSVAFEVEDRNTYWCQTLRKLKKSSKGEVIVKGRVRARRSKEKELSYYLDIETIQKTAGR